MQKNQPFDPPRCVRKLVLLQNDRELHEMLNDKDVQSYLTKCFTNIELLQQSNLQLTDVLRALKHLQVNDDFNAVLAKTSIVDALLDLVSDGNNKKGKSLAREVLTGLLLTEENRFVLSQNAKYSNVMKLKKDLKISAVVNARKLGLQWKAKISTGNQGHIMISYNRKDSHKIATTLDEKLRSAGHKTWIDNSGLTNDALDGMAHAVEGAKVVLLLMSSEYANSFNCRMEAQYAVELKKAIIPIVTENNYQARGWLGIITAGKIKMNLQSVEMVQGSTFDTLLKRIAALS